MAELSTLARPYAKAAFEYAADSGQMAQWSDALSLLGVVVQQQKILQLLTLPGYTPTQQFDALTSICGDSLSSGQQNFIKVLSEHRRLPLLAEISKQFEILKANREKTVDVEVVSASDISPEQQQQLSQALSERLQRAVAMHVTTDSSLLGGALIRAGDTVIDGSLRGRLAKLAEAMNL